MDSYDSFEKWINGMSDAEYEDRIESDVDNGGFTDNQYEKALNIRKPLSDEELDELEAEMQPGSNIKLLLKYLFGER